jgi:hypothetical protein
MATRGARAAGQPRVTHRLARIDRRKRFLAKSGLSTFTQACGSPFVSAADINRIRAQTYLASQIGNAVSNGNRSNLPMGVPRPCRILSATWDLVLRRRALLQRAPSRRTKDGHRRRSPRPRFETVKRSKAARDLLIRNLLLVNGFVLVNGFHSQWVRGSR